MKLYLLRHATAHDGFSEPDSERELTDYGIKQARQLSFHLEKIDMVLSSSAKRTRQTVENIIENAPTPAKIKYSNNLYNASEETLLEEIRICEPSDLLVVAHNPGIHKLAYNLAIDNGEPLFEKLVEGYPPCTLSIFDCTIEDWADLKEGQNNLTEYFTPFPIPNEQAVS